METESRGVGSTCRRHLVRAVIITFHMSAVSRVRVKSNCRIIILVESLWNLAVVAIIIVYYISWTDT